MRVSDAYVTDIAHTQGTMCRGVQLNAPTAPLRNALLVRNVGPIIFLSALLCFSPAVSPLQAQAHSLKKRAVAGSRQRPEPLGACPLHSTASAVASQTIPAVVSIIPTKLDKNRKEEQPSGSGVIISPDGFILTNCRVIREAKEAQVVLSDRKRYAAVAVGSDSLDDVAVIRIKGDANDLPAAYFGDSDSLLPGDWVMAVGNSPAAAGVSVGVVSACNRGEKGFTTSENFIHTDAALPPGHSGGALINCRGELVGIIAGTVSESEGIPAFGRAIPINTARHDAEDIIASGRVIRGWIGVSLQEISALTGEALGLSNLTGALVSQVVKGGPADRAEMASGDVITAIDGEPVRDGNDLRAKISDVKPGETVPVTVLRREEETELSVTVEELTPERLAAESGGRPATAAPVEAMETFGIEVTNLPPALRMKTGRPDAVSGVAVASVSPSVTDDRTLLKADDIIVRMKIEGGDLRDILTVNQFKADAARAKKGRPVLLLVARGGESFFISFKTP